MERLKNILEEVRSRLNIKVKNYEFFPNTSEKSLSLVGDGNIDSQHGTVEFSKLIVKYPRWLGEINDDALRGVLAHELGHTTRLAFMYRIKMGELYSTVFSFARKYESRFLGQILLYIFDIDVNIQLEKQGFKSSLDALRKFYKERGYRIA